MYQQAIEAKEALERGVQIAVNVVLGELRRDAPDQTVGALAEALNDIEPFASGPMSVEGVVVDGEPRLVIHAPAKPRMFEITLEFSAGRGPQPTRAIPELIVDSALIEALNRPADNGADE